MNMTVKTDLAMLLLRADESDFGIAVITNNPKLLRNQLYAERKRVGLLNLSFIQPPVGSESRLWIVKKEAKENGES